MDANYTKIRESIFSLELKEVKRFADDIFEDKNDKRSHAILALLDTETIYLSRIVKLLKEIFIFLDKKLKNKLRRSFVTKEQVAQLFHYFPRIYSLHVSLQTKLREDIRNSVQIGKSLLNFLSQIKVLEVYENYIEKSSDLLGICNIIETKSSDKILENLEKIIMSPIQRFPQLSLAIGDVFKYTADDHVDKINLFKSYSIAKSITARLDIKRRNYEYMDFKELQKILTRLGLPFSSSKVFSTHSVYVIKINLQSIEKVTRIPYSLMLCNQDLVLQPKNVIPDEVSSKTVFCNSLNDISLEGETLSRLIFHNQNCEDIKERSIRYSNFEEVKDLCLAMKGSTLDPSMLNKYKELLQDYDVLGNVNLTLKSLCTKYKDLEIGSVTKTILHLKMQLEEIEIDLNSHFNLILSLNNKVSNSSNARTILLFDSLRILNDWKINFNRAKILSSIQTETDWLYYSGKKDFLQMCANELPLVFEPYSFKKSKTINLKDGGIKYQSVSVVVSSLICRCLWVCLPKGRIIILHFDYKQWNILDSFNTIIKEPVVDLCTVTVTDPHCKRLLNSEIWMASGRYVFIHSLISDRNSELKEKLDLPSKISCLCNVESMVLVALQNMIVVFSKDENLRWCENYRISLEEFVSMKEEIRKMHYGFALVYVLCEKKVILCEKDEMKFLAKHCFKSDYNINSLSLSSDGVWTTFNERNNIILYDKYFSQEMQTISIPFLFSSLPPIGNITTIYTNDKYIWIGTAGGCIICVSTVDSTYCVDSNVPMYFCSKFASEAITEMIPFDNIQSIPFVKQKKEDFDDYCSMDESDPFFSDSSFTSPNPLLNVTTFEYTGRDEIDSVSDRSLHNIYKNWKDCTLTLMLAIGTGISKMAKKVGGRQLSFDEQTSQSDQPVIFTFFE